MMFEPVTIKLNKNKVKAIIGYSSMALFSSLYDFCLKAKIKVEEPKDREGLYTIFIIHIETVEQAMVFYDRYNKKISELARKAKALA